MKTLKAILPAALGATALYTLSAGAAFAQCDIESGSVRILSNDFQALRIVNAAAQECAGAGVTVTANATAEHKNIQGPALTINPAEYTVAGVANNSIMALLNEDLVRPLDDLIAQYGDSLLPNQLISVDGNVMGIAFMGNAQHMFYRTDILEEAGLDVPTSYEEVLEAAQVIRDAGLMQYPLAAANQPGWDLAAEFVNMYLGTGADFFAPGSAELAIDSEEGRATLAMMRAMTEFMDPDYLTFNANVLNQEWDAGNVAIMTQWGSLAGAAIGDSADPEIAANTAFAAAPTFNGGSIPAVALWWDGYTISRNISDEDAAASFQAMIYGAGPETAAAYPDVATWLVEGYQPGPAAVGVIETANAGARAYPMQPYMGLLHTALSAELAEFMAGQEDADQALADISAAYVTAAREAGFL